MSPLLFVEKPEWAVPFQKTVGHRYHVLTLAQRGQMNGATNVRIIGIDEARMRQFAQELPATCDNVKIFIGEPNLNCTWKEMVKWAKPIEEVIRKPSPNSTDSTAGESNPAEALSTAAPLMPPAMPDSGPPVWRSEIPPAEPEGEAPSPRRYAVKAVTQAVGRASTPARAAYQPSGGDVRKAATDTPGDGKRGQRGAEIPDAEITRKARNPIRCLSIAEFIERQAPDYSIKGIVTRRGLGVLFGETGSGKTFAALEIAMHIASGKPWRGRRVKRGGVIYVSAEGASGLTNRLRAYLRYHRLDPGDIALEIIPANVNLLNPGAQLEELITAIKDATKRIDAVSLIIIDTLNRTLQGGDENSSVDMSAYVNHVSILADAVDAFALIVHHCGKDASRGARGHSSLKAAVDVEIEVTKGSDGDRVITLTKSRDGEDGARFGFRLETVVLGEDADGDPIASCVVVPTEVAQQRQRVRTLSGVAQTALLALQEAVAEHGEVMPETSSIPGGVRAVRLDRWRAQFRLRYGSDGGGEDRDREAVKKAFQRGREALAKAQAVAISDPFAWLT